MYVVFLIQIKCESYLPETGSCDYGPFEVRVMGVEERDGCIIRHLALKVRQLETTDFFLICITEYQYT